MSKTVFSAAKEPVEIYSDDEWLELIGGNVRGVVYKPFDSTVGVLKALWHHGSYHSSNGLATTQMMPDAKRYGYRGSQVAVTGLFLRDLNAPAFEHETKGKRTYRISLVALPEKWVPYVTNGAVPRDSLEPEPVAAEPELEAALEKPEFPPGYPDATDAIMGLVDAPAPEPTRTKPNWKQSESEPVEPELVDSPYLEVLPQVAMSLLTQVVEIISAGKPSDVVEARVKQLNSNLDDALSRINDLIQDGNALRKRLRESGEELVAVKHERDGLRHRLRQTEYNLQQALSNDAMKQVDERVREELAKVMRAVPQGEHSHGDA